MSDLINDADILNGRRRNKLQDVEVDLRDQIVDDLFSKIKDKDFHVKTVDIWYKHTGQRRNWINRQQQFLADWDQFLPNNSEGPFEHSSQLHLPVAFTAVKTFHARMYQAIVGVEPPFNVRATRADGTERADMIEKLMSYTLREWTNRNQGIEEVLDTFIWDWVTTGVGILKVSWEKLFESFVDVELGPIEGQPEFFVDAEGKERSRRTIDIGEKETLRTIEKFVGPRVEHVRPEDLLLVGGEGNPDAADMVMHRQYLTADELWTLVDQRIFKEEAVREIIDSTGQNKSGGIDQDLKQQRVLQAGQSELDTQNDLNRYEILEVYASLDVLGAGQNSEVVMWVHTKTRELLRTTYLHRINKSGERPFAKIDFHKRPGADYGTGLVEVMHPLTVEIDAMHNMRIDFGMLSTMPYGFYRPSSNINPEEIELRPGMLIPVDNPQTDVFFPNLGNRTSFGFQEEAALNTTLERLTGISDLTLGVLSGQQGAARTATGARALIGEANANLDVHLRRLNQGWKKVLELIFHILQQRIPPGKTFRITGEDGDDYFAQVRDSRDLAGDFDFILSANTANSNQAITQQKADQVMNLVNNPLALQMGIVSQGNLYEAHKNWLQSRGVKDWGRFISKPSETTFILEPREEIGRILTGQQVQVVPQMDHQGFIDEVEKLLNSEEAQGLTEEHSRNLQQQAQQHQQMLEALNAQAAQTANVQQQQINSGAQNLDVGLNALDTGINEGS